MQIYIVLKNNFIQKLNLNAYLKDFNILVCQFGIRFINMSQVGFLFLCYYSFDFKYYYFD